MRIGAREDRQALGYCIFHPVRKLWSRLAILLDCKSKLAIGLGAIRGVEDGSQIGGYLESHRDLRYVLHGVLLQVELATLPRHAVETSFSGRGQSFMGIADDQLDAVQPSLDQRTE